MTNDVILKEVGPLWVASLRGTIPAYRSIGTLFGQLYAGLGPLAAQGGPGIALLHDTEYREENVDAEAGIWLAQAAPVAPPLTCYKLPPATVASIVHHGAFSRIGAAYGGLLRWIEANGYRPAGPTRELFLHIATPVTREDESNVTEIQVPVTKDAESPVDAAASLPAH